MISIKSNLLDCAGFRLHFPWGFGAGGAAERSLGRKSWETRRSIPQQPRRGGTGFARNTECRPSGAVPRAAKNPSADALGYDLPPLRGCVEATNAR